MTGVGIWSPAPYHILSYGSLLGTTFFHTFVGGIISYQTLNRPQFSMLMANIFPVYFSLQTALAALMALTYPSRTPLSSPSGIAGVLGPSNRWSVLAPIATIFITGLGNLAVVGPATTRCMNERKLQERKDGKKYYDSPPHSKAMVTLNKRFSILHGLSSLLNVISLVAVVVYTWDIASRLA